MGSLPGTCEIIELHEEMDSVKQSKEVNRGVDGKTGKLPMLKTGRSYALEDDINQLFEAINLKTSGKRLSQSLQSDRCTSSKNASKKPIGVGSPRTSGFGTSDSPTLKQALRRLAVSHASEMAAMKRLSKSVASPRISEAETIHKLYRTVVAEPNEVGLPPDKGKGNLLEISVGTEMATMNSSQKLHKSLQVSRANSPSPNARSPRIVDATKKNASGAKIPSRRDIIPEAKELGGTKNHGKKYLPLTRTKSPTTSAHSSPRLAVLTTITTKGSSTKVPAQDEILSEPTEVCGENSTLKLGEKGKLNTARCLPNSNTVRDVLEEDENVPTPKLGKETSVPELEIGSKSKLYPVPSSFSSSAGIKVSKSLANRTCAVKPVFKHKSVKKKKLKRDRGEAKDDGMAIGSSKLAKHKVKQISISKSNKSSIHGEIEDDGLLPSTSQLTCQTHNFNQKNARKEYSSPASSSTSLGVEVSSGNVDSCVSKPTINSNTRKGGTVGGKVSKSTKSKSREKGDFSQSSKSSIGEYSTSTSISEESNLSGSSFSASRPHMSKDMRWDAIHQVEARYGSLGLKHFKLLKRLGCGDIGTVYLAELSGTNCAFALKVMDNEYLACRKKMPRAQTEREILQMLDHPFLPTLYAHFTTNSFSCLVMEFCPGGDLHVLRQKQPTRCFSEQAARFYVAEVLLALEYLHMLGVIYRDLKPENILVREDGHIMLSDFDLSLRCSVSPMLLQSSSPVTEPTKNASGPCIGSSCIDPICLHPSCVQVSCFTPRLHTAGKPRKQKSDLPAQVSPLPQLVAEPTSARSNSFVGTHEYLAPEIIKGEGHGSAVDWWTFGIFLYELIYGRTPFKGSGNEDTLCNVVAESLKFPEYPLVSFQARDLIRGLLVKDPDNRLGSIKGATEIKHHPFFDGLNWALIRCAVPPELPKFVNPVLAAAASAMEKEDNKCIEFNDTGDHLEIELF